MSLSIKKYPFLKLACEKFRPVFEVSCWINLFVCAYYGYVIGNGMGRPETLWSPATPGHPALGFIIGAGVGLLSNILFGGLVAIILNIDENLRLLREKQVPNADKISAPVAVANSAKATTKAPPSIPKQTANNIEMAFVKGGTFTMGATPEQGEDSEDGEKPAHSVTVNDFHISKYLVTQSLWREVMGRNPSHFKDDHNCPVEKITWEDAQNFIDKLNKKSGKNYRLPTEAEWEYAARGGSMSKGFKYAGSNDADEVAYFENNSDQKTHPVGSKQPNELGIYDMSGNVWEWCNDWYSEYTSEPQTNPQGASSGKNRVARGGAWSIEVEGCRVSQRGYLAPYYNEKDVGFRLVLSA